MLTLIYRYILCFIAILNYSVILYHYILPFIIFYIPYYTVLISYTVNYILHM